MRILLDPNVLLSALIAPNGTSAQAVRAASIHATIVTSPHLLDRFTRRARDEKFRRWFQADEVAELARRLADLSDMIDDPDHVPAVILADPTDDYLVAIALAGNAELLVTGDKGIRRALQDSGVMRVASPREFLDLIS